MNTAPVSESTDLLALFSKYRGMIISCTLLSVAVFAAAAFTLPKRYKSTFVLSIYSNYFQNPLTRDFMSEIYDSAEMRAQRETLIRQSLTPEFIDSLGEKHGMYGRRATQNFLQRFSNFLGENYGLYLTAREMRTRSKERKALMSRIQIFNLNNDTFQVSFLYSDPNITYQVTQDLYTHITEGLMNSRRNSLGAVHSAIQKRLEALASRLPTLEKSPPPGDAAAGGARPEPSLLAAEEELADVRTQLRVLTTRYTDEHPLVRELRDRERALSATVRASGGNVGPTNRSTAVRIPQDAAAEIYRELTKKLNYLNVALDSAELQTSDYFATLETPLYPAAPLWPKKGLFLIWGLGMGLLGSLFIAAIREYFERSTMRPALLSQRLNLPVLGEMPLVRWGSAFPYSTRNGAALEAPAPRI